MSGKSIREIAELAYDRGFSIGWGGAECEPSTDAEEAATKAKVVNEILKGNRPQGEDTVSTMKAALLKVKQLATASGERGETGAIWADEVLKIVNTGLGIEKKKVRSANRSKK